MIKKLGALALMGSALLLGPVHANEKLAQSSGCMTCHSVEKKVLGPSYKDIAGKYRGDAGAESALIKKVKGGSKGVWGPVPMPPNPHVKDEDAKAIVQWILALP